MMFVRTLTGSENKDAAKITSALADSRVYSSLYDGVKFGENSVFVLGSCKHFS